MPNSDLLVMHALGLFVNRPQNSAVSLLLCYLESVFAVDVVFRLNWWNDVTGQRDATQHCLLSTVCKAHTQIIVTNKILHQMQLDRSLVRWHQLFCQDMCGECVVLNATERTVILCWHTRLSCKSNSGILPQTYTHRRIAQYPHVAPVLSTFEPSWSLSFKVVTT